MRQGSMIAHYGLLRKNRRIVFLETEESFLETISKGEIYFVIYFVIKQRDYCLGRDEAY